MELNEKLYLKILKVSEGGDRLVEAGRFKDAMKKYQRALSLIPEPKSIWEASTWIYAALGDTSYLNKQYNNAIDYLFETLKCPDGLGNPFVLLRLGECFFEINNIDKAQEYLLQAYMCEGIDIFEGEDNKYFSLIRTLI